MNENYITIARRRLRNELGFFNKTIELMRIELHYKDQVIQQAKNIGQKGKDEWIEKYRKLYGEKIKDAVLFTYWDSGNVSKEIIQPKSFE